MPQEATDRKPPKNHQGTTAPPPPPPEQEHLRCPRCDSTNTKFCYYNNYNLSQPRHFCKACRRYWTHGGTLRDIPIGGGSRKNAKRSRTSAAGPDTQHPLPANPVIFPVPATVYGGGQPCGGEGKGSLGLCGSFTSLLNSNGPGFLALSGFGLGIGPALDDMAFGLGKGSGTTVWPFPGIGEGGAAAISGGGGGASVGLASPWQFESGDQGGLIPGDCFTTWSDLVISTPGNGLK